MVKYAIYFFTKKSTVQDQVLKKLFSCGCLSLPLPVFVDRFYPQIIFGTIYELFLPKRTFHMMGR